MLEEEKEKRANEDYKNENSKKEELIEDRSEGNESNS